MWFNFISCGHQIHRMDPQHLSYPLRSYHYHSIIRFFLGLTPGQWMNLWATQEVISSGSEMMGLDSWVSYRPLKEKVPAGEFTQMPSGFKSYGLPFVLFPGSCRQSWAPPVWETLSAQESEGNEGKKVCSQRNGRVQFLAGWTHTDFVKSARVENSKPPVILWSHQTPVLTELNTS